MADENGNDSKNAIQVKQPVDKSQEGADREYRHEAWLRRMAAYAQSDEGRAEFGAQADAIRAQAEKGLADRRAAQEAAAKTDTAKADTAKADAARIEGAKADAARIEAANFAKIEESKKAAAADGANAIIVPGAMDAALAAAQAKKAREAAATENAALLAAAREADDDSASVQGRLRAPKEQLKLTDARKKEEEQKAQQRVEQEAKDTASAQAKTDQDTTKGLTDAQVDMLHAWNPLDHSKRPYGKVWIGGIDSNPHAGVRFFTPPATKLDDMPEQPAFTVTGDGVQVHALQGPQLNIPQNLYLASRRRKDAYLQKILERRQMARDAALAHAIIVQFRLKGPNLEVSGEATPAFIMNVGKVTKALFEAGQLTDMQGRPYGPDHPDHKGIKFNGYTLTRRTPTLFNRQKSVHSSTYRPSV